MCVVPVLCSPGWGSSGDTTPEPLLSSSSLGSELGWKQKLSRSVLVLSARNSSLKTQGNHWVGKESAPSGRRLGTARNGREEQENPSLSLSELPRAVRKM